MSAAAHLKKHIEQQTGRRTWVQAVIVFWSEFPEGLVDDGRCVFIYGPQLQAWMRCLPELLDQVKVDDIATAIGLLGSNDPA